MKFKALLTVNSILAFASGAVCVLIPAQLLAHYDVVLSPMGLVIYQFWGATLIGLGMIIWFARGSTVVFFKGKSRWRCSSRTY